MNRLTERLTSPLRPRAALIAYRGDEPQGANHMLELRTIDERGRLGQGMPVTYDFLRSITEHFSEAHSGVPYGAVPSNLLYADPRKGRERIVWWDPPRRRMLYFRPSLGLESAEYFVPGVVYSARENALDVYAYKGQSPDEGCALFAAPFFNVTGSSVCLGSARLERPSDPTYDRLIGYWEQRFWLTEFSHLGGQGNPTHSNLVLATQAARNKAFDTDELQPLNQTLTDVLK